MTSARQLLTVPSEAACRTVADLIQRGDQVGLLEVIATAADDTAPTSITKPILGAVVFGLRDSKTFSDAKTRVVLEGVLKSCSQGRLANTFGEECLSAREVLTDIAQEEGRLADALQILSQVPTDNTALRSGQEKYRFHLFVRMGEIALQLDNQHQAESFLTRAWPLLKHASDNDIRHRFHFAFANVHDQNRKFFEAASRYYTVSHQLEHYQEALRNAIVCLVLADAGPQRARLLAIVARDERIAALGDLGAMLVKVAHQRILRDKDVASLQPFLLTHHKAVSRFGRTVVDNAISQHNLLSASQLYYNISFTELGSLLSVAPNEAERIAAQMISEDRLKAVIDHVKQSITFLAAAGETVPLQVWDVQIASLCQGASAVADAICRRRPELLGLLEA